MSVSILIYLAGLAVIYVGERLLSGYESLNMVLVAAGLVGVIGAMALRVNVMKATTDPGLRWAHRRMLDFFGVALLGLALYFVVSLKLSGDEATAKAAGVLTALWPVALLVASIVLLVLDHAIESSPVVLPQQQVARALWSGLSVSFAIALVFPLNYLGEKHNERWDFSYFRTAEPGTATKAIIAGLPETIDVRIFQPTSSDVLAELQNYFAQIDSPKLRVQVLDQAAVPVVAKDLRIRDNGYIAFTQGPLVTPKMSDEDKKRARKMPRTETVKIGVDLDEARPKLKNLDKEIQKALLSFARGEINSYVTVGHGELTWGGGESNPLRTMKGTKQILEFMNLDPKKLGLTEGLGEAVPDDADVVLVLGPDRGLLKAEVDALRAYLKRGGSLLLAIEPRELRTNRPEFETEDTLGPLLDDLGLSLGEGVLASTNMIVPTANNLTDRFNVATDSFSSHPSTVVLSKQRAQLKLFTPGAGHLVQKANAKPKVTVTVRSQGGSWADRNMNLQLDTDQAESKTARPLAVAVEGPGAEGFRAIVVADASLFADFPIVNPGNQQFIYDSLNWLTGQEAMSGEVENEEDVRIQHTSEGQAGWFYSTVIGVPFLFFAFGAVRLRIRRRKGGAE